MTNNPPTDPIPIICFTSQKNSWAVPPFAYLFRTFWSQTRRVIVSGCSTLPYSLPSNFEFMPVEDRPSGAWTNSLLDLCSRFSCAHIILMLEDFWLNNPVDVECVAQMEDFARGAAEYEKILRIDLSADRSSMAEAVPYMMVGSTPVVRTPAGTPYQMSYQAAIWNRIRLMEVLQPNEDPWMSEIEGTKRLAHRPDLLVLGTTVRPVPYAHVLRRNRRGLQNLDQIPDRHRDVVRAMTPHSLL